MKEVTPLKVVFILVSTLLLGLLTNLLIGVAVGPEVYANSQFTLFVISFLIGLIGPGFFYNLYKEF